MFCIGYNLQQKLIIETENVIQMSLTQKGKEKIILNGFSYNFGTRSDNIFRWYCDKRRLN